MANKTIPELTPSSSILPTHLIPFDTGSQTFKATVADLANTFADLERDRALPAWSSAVTYANGAIVRDVSNKNGFLYVSIQNNNTNHALTDTAWWRKLNNHVSTISSNTTLTDVHNGGVLLCNSVSGSFNITLFAGPAPKHTFFTIKDSQGFFGANPVTIVRVGSEKIENAESNYICNRRFGSYTFITDGTDWFIIDQMPTGVDQYGKVVIGPNFGVGTTGSAYHTLHGSLIARLAASSTTGVFASPNFLELFINAYRDSGGNKKAINTATGFTKFTLYKGVGASSPILTVEATTDGQTADSAVTETNLKTLLQILAGGGITFDQIHNNAYGNIVSGRWVATITPVTNVNAAGSSTTSSGLYSRVGNIVTCSILVTIKTDTGTAATPATAGFDISLPIATAMTGIRDLTGTAVHWGSPAIAPAGRVYANFTDDRATVNFASNSTIGSEMTIMFQYEIK